MVSREDIGKLLNEIKIKSNHHEFVIMGSLSILGFPGEVPLGMMASNDVDLYFKNDPGRDAGIAEFGEDSDFHEIYGYYADKISPNMPSLPEGWEKRLLPIRYADGIAALFLEPNDCAVSKYMRGQENDLRWIKQGLEANILDIAVIKDRLRTVFNCLDGEREKARILINIDEQYLSLRNACSYCGQTNCSGGCGGGSALGM